MHTLKLLLTLLSTLPLLTACSSSDDNSDDGNTPTVSISVSACTIAEGAAYEAATLRQAIVTYSAPVAVSSSVAITLNGTPCQTALSGADRDIVVLLPMLADDTAYTLTIPEGVVVSRADPKAKAPAFSVSFTTRPAAQPADDSPAGLAQRLGWGWNLGNHFDTSSGEDGKPTPWGYWDNATPTPALYASLKKAGASTVRIGVTWGNHQNPATWDIDAAYMAEVRQNVEMAEAAGLNVILNMHHDEYWLDIKQAAANSATNEAIKQRIEKTWRQIAEAFKDKGSFLFFESFNEIQDGSWGWGDNQRDGGRQYRTLNEWNQLVVNTIRATGGNNATRWIGIPGYASSPSFVLISDFVLPADDAGRLMVSVHFYDPNTFTLTPVKDGKTEWGHTAAPGKYQQGSNEDHVTDTFRRLHDKFIANGIPVYIGEYGCVMHTTQRSNFFRRYYLEYVCRAAHTYGMPLCIWDNNVSGGGDEHHGYFNHTDGSYLNASATLVQTMVSAATSDDPDYTLDTVYNKAP